MGNAVNTLQALYSVKPAKPVSTCGRDLSIPAWSIKNHMIAAEPIICVQVEQVKEICFIYNLLASALKTLKEIAIKPSVWGSDHKIV